MSSGNKKIEHPSFRATLIMYVAFNFFSSSITTTKKSLNFFIHIEERVLNFFHFSQTNYIKKILTSQKIIPLSPLDTRFQLTTLGSTALRRSRKNSPFERFLS